MKTYRKFPKSVTPARGNPSRWAISWYLIEQRRKRAEGTGNNDDSNTISTESGLIITTEDGQKITIE